MSAQFAVGFFHLLQVVPSCLQFCVKLQGLQLQQGWFLLMFSRGRLTVVLNPNIFQSSLILFVLLCCHQELRYISDCCFSIMLVNYYYIRPPCFDDSVGACGCWSPTRFLHCHSLVLILLGGHTNCCFSKIHEVHTTPSGLLMLHDRVFSRLLLLILLFSVPVSTFLFFLLNFKLLERFLLI